MLEIPESSRDPHLQIRLDENLPPPLVAQRLEHLFQRPLLDLHSRRAIGQPLESIVSGELLGLIGRGRHRGDDQPQHYANSFHSG